MALSSLIAICGRPITGKTKIVASPAEPTQLELDLDPSNRPSLANTFPKGASGRGSRWDLGLVLVPVMAIAVVLGAILAWLLP
ncbi:hypothetical protein [Inquilinus sp. OTU3971]|uniref:hypothetical protein n=1 Tax=Inquilinus sp. OTU3971 TaxID=3043855 RepID=UPI00313CC161